MKKKIFFICVFISFILFGCEKEKSTKNTDSKLIERSEKHLRLKSGQTIYVDENNNKYFISKFSPDTLSHIYSIYFEKDKKYNLSISGDYCVSIDFLLLNSSEDTLFYGEQGNSGLTRKYIVWLSNVTDTLFISVHYVDDINFHTYVYHITFEELTIKQLQWNELTFNCSGNWFVDKNNNLALACYSSSYSKWAKLNDISLFNYQFSFQVGLKSGIPDIYTGVAIYASDEIFEMFNVPDKCYEFKIIGPSSWEIWTCISGVGREWGETYNILNRGQGAWNEIQLKTINDSIKLSVNSEIVKSFKNLHFMDNGLYLIADDQKDDTIYFRNIELIK